MANPSPLEALSHSICQGPSAVRLFMKAFDLQFGNVPLGDVALHDLVFDLVGQEKSLLSSAIIPIRPSRMLSYWLHSYCIIPLRHGDPYNVPFDMVGRR